MYENLISDICEKLRVDLRYKNVNRVRVNPYLYHELAIVVDKIFHETQRPVFIIEDPMAETYVIE